MQILADENLPGPVVERLRADGHDVLWIREIARGISDTAILSMATEKSRLVVTLDKDFGELVFRDHLPAPAGIVLLRMTSRSPDQLAALVSAALQSRTDWNGRFSVLEDSRIRMINL